MVESCDREIEKLVRLLSKDEANERIDDVQITKADLMKLSSRLKLSAYELDIIFTSLDTDEDGIITGNDLKSKCQAVKSVNKTDGSFDSEYVTNVSLTAVTDIDALSEQSQEQVCELYQHLHASQNQELLGSFESIVLGVIRDIKSYQTENQRLESSFKREKEQHERHLRQLEEDMESQMQNAEETIRQKEQDRFEAEKEATRKDIEAEMKALQHNLKKLKEEGLEEKSKEHEEMLMSLQNRLGDLTTQNRQLQSELTDSHTVLSVIKSDLTKGRQQYQEKCHELKLERQTLMDYIKEQDNLTRQLHLLHDANQQLLDTNDNLQEALESSRRSSPIHVSTPVSYRCGREPPHTAMDRYYGTYLHRWRRNARESCCCRLQSSERGFPVAERKGSAISDCLNTTNQSLHSLSLCTPSPSLCEEPIETEFDMPPHSYSTPRLVRAPVTQDTHESLVDDLAHSTHSPTDSGHSTMRDLNEQDSEPDDADQYMLRSCRKHRRLRAAHTQEEEVQEFHDEMEPEMEHPVILDNRIYRLPGQRKSGSGDNRRNRRDGRESPISPISPISHRSSIRRSTQDLSKHHKDPERMFKIVLAGDAAVGKSSFIMRLCKGKFENNLTSTLGVDFQTKLLEVDGKSVALQLWDTAGQERFRSIAKSYFRRADGVLLLYDCTYERSFLNVRDWMEAIQDSAQKQIPIMLAANKVDMRAEASQQGRRIVAHEDGQRLAREFDALFIETSAKDGSNIYETVIELSRLLQASEDLEVKTVGLQLHNANKEKKGKGGCC